MTNALIIDDTLWLRCALHAIRHQRSHHAVRTVDASVGLAEAGPSCHHVAELGAAVPALIGSA